MIISNVAQGKGKGIAIINVTMLESYWTLRGLNLFVYSSDLGQTMISIGKTNDQKQKGLIYFHNSTFGQLKVPGGFHVELFNCNIDGTSRLETTLLDIRDSNLIIKKSSFYNNRLGWDMHGPVLLNAFYSSVYIMEANFTHNTGYSSYPLLFIESGSGLDTEQVTFEDNFNYPVVYLYNYVMATGNNTKLIYNDLGILCERYVNFTSLTYSLFTSNGKDIKLTSSSVMAIAHSRFKDNINPNTLIAAEDDSSVTIERSFFLAYGNKKTFEISSYSNLTVSDCVIKGQVTDESYIFLGANDLDDLNVILKVISHADAQFTNCSFTGTTALVSAKQSSVFIADSLITNPSQLQTEFKEVFIYMFNEGHLYISGSNITDNIPAYSKTFVSAKTKSSVTMVGCMYTGNSFTSHFIIEGNSTISVSDSHIINNNSTTPIITISGSKYLVTRSIFEDNRGYRVGLLNASESYVEWEGCTVQNNDVQSSIVIKGMEIIVVEYLTRLKSSDFIIRNCTFKNNPTIMEMETKLLYQKTNYLQISHSNFSDNILQPFDITNVADVSIQKSSFQMSGLAIKDTNTVRIAESTFHSGLLDLWTMHSSIKGTRITLYTFRSNFSDNGTIVRSDADGFLRRAHDLSILDRYTVVHHFETEYASHAPVPCNSSTSYTCYCHYKQDERSNIYSCTSQTVHTFPSLVPSFTDTLLVRNTNITKLCGSLSYTKTLRTLDLRMNSISRICESFVMELIKDPTSGSSYLEKIWLSGNPFHCDCEMTWMIGWLNGFITYVKKPVIADCVGMICSSGIIKGQPIYKLNEVKMGCFPSKWSIGQKIGIGIGTGIAILIIVWLTFIVLKRSRDIMFFIYYYCKWCTCFGIPRDDPHERFGNMFYDAFLCYR